MTKKFLSVAMAALLSSGAIAQPEKKAYMVADAHLDTHSCRETGSTADHIFTVKAFTQFFK